MVMFTIELLDGRQARVFRNSFGDIVDDAQEVARLAILEAHAGEIFQPGSIVTEVK